MSQIELGNNKLKRAFRSAQSLSLVRLFVTPWTSAGHASLSITSSWSWLKLMSIQPVMPSNSHPLSSSPSSAFNLSQHQGLVQWVSSSHQETKRELGKRIISGTLDPLAFLLFLTHERGPIFIGSVVKKTHLQCRRQEFDLWVRKIPLKEEMATHFSIFAWKIPQTEKPGGPQSMELKKRWAWWPQQQVSRGQGEWWDQ